MGGNQSKGDEVDQIQLDGHLQVKSYPRGKTVRQRELLNPYYAYTPYSTLQNPHYVAPPPYRPIGGRNDDGQYGYDIQYPYQADVSNGDGYGTQNVSRSAAEGLITRDPMSGMNIQNYENFNEEINGLLYVQPLIIHTHILPPGVSPDDPRLQNAKVISERTYTTNKPIFPRPSFTATIHQSLIAPHEPGCRLVTSD